jgi:alpha-1,6-mannosyltransferase
VGAPLRKVLAEGVDGFSETLADLGGKLSDLLEGGAEAMFGAVFKKCDLTMAATPKQAARIAEYGVAGTAVVPLGVDLRTFSPERATPLFRERLGVGAEDVLLIYCGRLDAEKEVTSLVDALAQLPTQPRFHLAVMGEGPLRGELQARASVLPRLHVLPYESDPRAYAAALASSDIYVTAGPHETFGLAVVEAQACGLPVVGVDAGALRERVLPELGRLGPAGDSQAMAANIVEVAGCRRSMGEAARRHVLTAGYDWDRTFRDLFALYRAAIAQSA